MRTLPAKVTLFLVNFALVSLVFGQTYTAREIAEKVANRNQGTDSYSQIQMQLINASGQTRERTLILESKEFPDGTHTYLEFIAPSDIAGTKLLIFEHQNAEDDLWLYLPAIRKVRRISSSQKYRSFVGTDFSYADLGSRNVDEYDYKITGRDSIEGKYCYILESTEKKGANAQYYRIVSWIDPASWIPLKSEMYDDENTLYKKLNTEQVKQFSDVWMPQLLTMENVQDNTKTILHFKEIRINTGLKDEIFTKRNLMR